jgi:hypothetical protein
MLLDEFFGIPDVFPATIFLAVGGAFHQVLIVRWHDIVQVFGYLNTFLAHYGLLLSIRKAEAQAEVEMKLNVMFVSSLDLNLNLNLRVVNCRDPPSQMTFLSRWRS